MWMITYHVDWAPIPRNVNISNIVVTGMVHRWHHIVLLSPVVVILKEGRYSPGEIYVNQYGHFQTFISTFLYLYKSHNFI